MKAGIGSDDAKHIRRKELDKRRVRKNGELREADTRLSDQMNMDLVNNNKKKNHCPEDLDETQSIQLKIESQQVSTGSSKKVRRHIQC